MTTSKRIIHGGLYMADLAPHFGTEQGKVRPVLVLQSNLFPVPQAAARGRGQAPHARGPLSVDALNGSCAIACLTLVALMRSQRS